MITTVQYDTSISAANKAKKLGFELTTRGSGFVLSPKNQMAGALVTDTTGRNFADLENLLNFLNGWDAAISLLGKRAGVTLEEITTRIEQQTVMDTLSDKKRRNVRL